VRAASSKKKKAWLASAKKKIPLLTHLPEVALEKEKKKGENTIYSFAKNGRGPTLQT
jgi:hypothetical protein